MSESTNEIIIEEGSLLKITVDMEDPRRPVEVTISFPNSKENIQDLLDIDPDLDIFLAGHSRSVHEYLAKLAEKETETKPDVPWFLSLNAAKAGVGAYYMGYEAGVRGYASSNAKEFSAGHSYYLKDWIAGHVAGIIDYGGRRTGIRTYICKCEDTPYDDFLALEGCAECPMGKETCVCAQRNPGKIFTRP